MPLISDLAESTWSKTNRSARCQAADEPETRSDHTKKKIEKKVKEPDTDEVLWATLMQVRRETQDIQRDLDRLDQMRSNP